MKDKVVPTEDMTIELVCNSGHRSVHSRDRLLRRNNAWCGICGADLICDPEKPMDGVDLEKAAGGDRPPRLKVAR